MTNFTLDNKSNNWCKPLWDTKLCWPTAALNETIEFPCPAQQFENQTASRTCIMYSDGIEGDRPIWTMGDYALCPDPGNYTYLFIAVAREQYLQVWDKLSTIDVCAFVLCTKRGCSLKMPM